MAATDGPKITFWGAAGQVTGSMHLIEAEGTRVLLDSGMFQGRRAEAQALNAELRLDPTQIDALVLSHAHIDHCGRLPLLVKRGYAGPIHATPATCELTEILLRDAANIQVKDHAHMLRYGHAQPGIEPLYDLQDAERVFPLLRRAEYGQTQHIVRPFSFRFVDAGHILGSASVELMIGGRHPQRLVFSGDIGRWGMPIIRDPHPPRGAVDTLIIESTYAARDHEPVAGTAERLGQIVRETAAQGGKILIPSFALGRAQELIYSLHELWRAGQIPRLPIYIDSPMASRVTEVFEQHPELYDRREKLLATGRDVFEFPLLHFVADVDASKALNGLAYPAVIIAASGMAESGRIVHHLSHHIENPRTTVLFVGYQAEHTLGRRIQEGQHAVKILGEDRTVRARVETIGGYSAHADRSELRTWVRGLGGPIRRAFVVHGEAEGLSAMAAILREEGVDEVHVPRMGESFEVG